MTSKVLWSEFRRRPLAVIGLVFVAALFLVALFAPWLSPHSPTAYDLDAILLPPSLTHPFGTDEEGRDVLSRMIFGTRVSLSVGLIAVAIYVLIGIILGALA
jgi:peptide/nickel transport system permease protein